jgi:ribonuclease HI
MGGEGSISSMITALKNNNLLRKRIPIFKRQSDFTRIRKAYRRSTTKITNKKEPTPEEREWIKARALAKLKQELYIRWVKNTLFLALVALSIFAVYKNSQLETTYHPKVPGLEAIKPGSKSQPITSDSKYAENMDLGIEQLQENKWFYAAGYFETALKNKPGDEHAEYNLALSYCLLCYNEKKACKRAEGLLDKLIKEQPENERLRQLRSRYLIR